LGAGDGFELELGHEFGCAAISVRSLSPLGRGLG
jgi:hypothetical protein